MMALILSAGYGTRLRPLTDTLPKVLVPVLGVPILERILAFMARSGVTHAAINTHYLAAELEAYLTALRPRLPGLTIQSFQEPVILGTGGAIPNLGVLWTVEPLLVWNGDVLADCDLAVLSAAHDRSGVVATLLVQDRPGELSRLLVDESGQVAGIDSPARGGRRVLNRSQDGLRPLAFTGVCLLASALKPWLARPAPFDLIDVLLDAIAAGAVVRAQDLGAAFWGTCGTRDEWAAMEADLAARPDVLARFSMLA